jgi:hypothetical protein
MTTPQTGCIRPTRRQRLLAQLRGFYQAWLMLQQRRYRELEAILDDAESAPRDC